MISVALDAVLVDLYKADPVRYGWYTGHFVELFMNDLWTLDVLLSDLYKASPVL